MPCQSTPIGMAFLLMPFISRQPHCLLLPHPKSSEKILRRIQPTSLNTCLTSQNANLSSKTTNANTGSKYSNSNNSNIGLHVSCYRTTIVRYSHIKVLKINELRKYFSIILLYTKDIFTAVSRFIETPISQCQETHNYDVHAQNIHVF